MLDYGDYSELKISPKVRSLLKAVSSWCLLTSTLGFILAITGVFMIFFMFTEFSRHSIREDEIIGLIIMAISILFMFLFSRFLFIYRRNLRKSLELNSTSLFEKALTGLRNAIIMISIIWIIGTALMIFIISIIIYFLLNPIF